MSKATVHVLDYGAGNVRSLKNALHVLGYATIDVESIQDIQKAEILLFPGVGNFQQAMAFLTANNYVDALKDYIKQNKRYLGICLGMQTLFEGSEECPGVKGLGVVSGCVQKFPTENMSVPHIGWNGINAWKESPLFAQIQPDTSKVYFVHSFRATHTEANAEWVLTTTNYGDVEFISSIQRGNVMATQFHPEKSGAIGLAMLKGFLESNVSIPVEQKLPEFKSRAPTKLCKRVIA